jgi:hypothetical protein
MSPPPDAPSPDERGGIGPYLAVLLVALVVVVALAVYVAGYREEIIAILTQSPT